MRAGGAAVALGAVAVAAFALRAVGAEHVFPADGLTVLQLGDGAYHARLARWTLAHFPSFLTWDSYLNAPLGGAVPWPPLFDLGVAGVARAFGGSDVALERVLAWSAPLLAAATGFPIYAAARMVAGPGVAVGAAAIHALFGPSLGYGAVGNGDHHAAVAFCGACLLAAALALAREDARGRRLVPIGVALALAHAAVVLVWNGSLLLLVVTDGLLLLLLTAWGRREALLTLAAGLAVTAALATPVVLAWPRVIGGPWSAVALSRLHLLVLAAGALVVAAETPKPAPARTRSAGLPRRPRSPRPSDPTSARSATGST